MKAGKPNLYGSVAETPGILESSTISMKAGNPKLCEIAESVTLGNWQTLGESLAWGLCGKQKEENLAWWLFGTKLGESSA